MSKYFRTQNSRCKSHQMKRILLIFSFWMYFVIKLCGSGLLYKYTNNMDRKIKYRYPSAQRYSCIFRCHRRSFEGATKNNSIQFKSSAENFAFMLIDRNDDSVRINRNSSVLFVCFGIWFHHRTHINLSITMKQAQKDTTK